MLVSYFHRATVSPDSWGSMIKMASPWLHSTQAMAARLALGFHGSGKKKKKLSKKFCFCRDEKHILIVLVTKKFNAHYDCSEALSRNTNYHYSFIQINMSFICIYVYSYL